MGFLRSQGKAKPLKKKVLNQTLNTAAVQTPDVRSVLRKYEALGP